MLLANRKVAEFIGKRKAPLTFVYRIHDDPDEEKLLKLKSTISQFGYQLEINPKNISGALNQLLLDCNGKKEQNLIDTMTLRCMSKAEYSTKNIGHYGLAFNHYSHFTSPIRRYPDLMVHRLLQHYLEGGTAVKEDLWKKPVFIVRKENSWRPKPSEILSNLCKCFIWKIRWEWCLTVLFPVLLIEVCT